MQTSAHVIRTREELQTILGKPPESQAHKCSGHIDQHCRTWIACCPFIVIASATATALS